jgi:hypothetical protein
VKLPKWAKGQTSTNGPHPGNSGTRDVSIGTNSWIVGFHLPTWTPQGNTPWDVFLRYCMKGTRFHHPLGNTPRVVLHQSWVKVCPFHLIIANTPRGVLLRCCMKQTRFQHTLSNTPRGVLHKNWVKECTFHLIITNTPRGVLLRCCMKGTHLHHTLGTTPWGALNQESCEVIQPSPLDQVTHLEVCDPTLLTEKKKMMAYWTKERKKTDNQMLIEQRKI